MLQNAQLACLWKRRRSLPPLRRPRAMTRVEVVVPTLRQLDARRERARVHSQRRPSPSHIKAEEEDTQTHFLLQARIKAEEVKSENATSENMATQDRLATLGHEAFEIRIPRDILEVTTTRTLLARIWGGCMRYTFPKIGKQFTHGLDDFMYANLSYDPHAPRWPGSPGLSFGFRDDGQEWPKIMRLIVRLGPNVWQYMGQYKLTAAPPLTPNEWRAQSLQVKRRWAHKLSAAKLGSGVKAKIALRERLGRDPTARELTIALRSRVQFDASPKEILQAYDEGRAVVYVWYMKCVGYDADFQQRIVAGSRGYSPHCPVPGSPCS